eukprot:COSAG05_NODE_2650_length_2802_cov_556.150203_2_plen_259_part_00
MTLRGMLPSGFNPTAWHQLKLVLTSLSTAALLDGVTLFNVSSRDGASGYVALGSSYAACEFDNFSYYQLPSPPIPPPVAGAAVAFEPCAPASQPLSAHQHWVQASDSDSGGVGCVTLHPTTDRALCLDFSDISQLRTATCAPKRNDTHCAADTRQTWNISSESGAEAERGSSAVAGAGSLIRAVGALCPSGSGGTPVGGCCMEMSGNDHTPGTAADLYACEANGGVLCANEVFTRPGLIDGMSQIVVQSTGFCLTVLH